MCESQFVRTLQTKTQVASANVVGGGGGSGFYEYSPPVLEQEANQANIGCVIAACVNFAEQNTDS